MLPTVPCPLHYCMLATAAIEQQAIQRLGSRIPFDQCQARECLLYVKGKRHLSHTISRCPWLVRPNMRLRFPASCCVTPSSSGSIAKAPDLPLMAVGAFLALFAIFYLGTWGFVKCLFVWIVSQFEVAGCFGSGCDLD